ncbi:MAG: helix-turn-helix transcriptional regulator [Bacteroidetes bacterium]|nr:helix-turn-helix transcriptional regulator [Bacteroidota bacterium]
MQEKSIIKQNILRYLDFKGITPYKCYQETGITRGVLTQNNGMSEENTSKFLAYYTDVNIEWLLTGNGEMIKSTMNFLRDPSASYFKNSDEKLKDTQIIPLYSIEASAGIVTLFSDTSSTKPIDFIQIPNLPKCDGAVYVTGDSMYPLLKSGDIVMYKQIHDIKNGIFWGEMYLLSIDLDGDELVTVKYIQKSEVSKRHIKLVSQNKHHDDRDVELSKVRAIALVKASIRINSMS